MELKPVNVAGATIVVQICLLTIIGLAVAVERENNSRVFRSGRKQRSYGLTLALAIMTLIVIALSSDYYPIWAPLLGDISLPTINRSHAFMFVFLLDILATIFLIEWTGRPRSSPFTSILFLIPALAIFLREPPGKFIFYAAIVGVYYYFSCENARRNTFTIDDNVDGSLHSHRVVNLGCLGLAMLTGYITRPVPV